MKNRVVLIIIGILIKSILFAQNIVLNPSFEDTLSCPNALNGYPFYGVDQVSKSKYWNSARNNPEYFNCNLNYGYNSATQPASDGTARIGLSPYVHNGVNAREYLIGQLSQPLTIGQEYYVSMKVKPSTKQCVAINNMGLLFTNLNYNSNTPRYNYQNFAHINHTTIISDTANWTKVEGFFIADSAYNYILIGNFYDDANTDTLIPWNLCTNSNNSFAYYFIDEICVTTDSSTCHIITELNELKSVKNSIILYPNPLDNFLYFKNEDNIGLKIDLFDYTGKLVYSDFSFRNIYSIDLQNYSKGVYFIRLTNEEEGVYISRKVIKK